RVHPSAGTEAERIAEPARLHERVVARVREQLVVVTRAVGCVALAVEGVEVPLGAQRPGVARHRPGANDKCAGDGAENERGPSERGPPSPLSVATLTAGRFGSQGRTAARIRPWSSNSSIPAARLGGATGRA